MPSGSSPPATGRPSGLIWNWWNLLLVVPLLMLITPMINFDEPRLLGLPFFYWSQFAFVPLGVVCVGLVYLKTRDVPVAKGAPDRLDVDQLDEGDKA